MRLKDIPNIITISRIILVVPIALLLNNNLFFEALILFFIAGFSDGLDGFLAKRFKWKSEFGATLDPIADKFMIIVVYLTCSYIHILPWWLTLTVIARDVTIILGIIFYSKKIHKITMSPSIISKINTFLQISLVLVLMLQHIHTIFPQNWIESSFYIVLTTTVLSGADYIWTWGVKAFKKDAHT